MARHDRQVHGLLEHHDIGVIRLGLIHRRIRLTEQGLKRVILFWKHGKADARAEIALHG